VKAVREEEVKLRGRICLSNATAFYNTAIYRCSVPYAQLPLEAGINNSINSCQLSFISSPSGPSDEF